MDDEFREIKSAHSADRYRSPSFTLTEVKTLVKLVEKYKVIVLNKSTTAVVSHAKELAWLKIAKIFNSQGFENKREPECLKTKWDNLKRNTKKVSKNLIDTKHAEFDELTNQVVALMYEAETSSNMIDIPQEIEEELKEVVIDQKKENTEPVSKCYENMQESDSSDSDDDIRKHRSLNFSPTESSILLKCVKDEKRYVFSKANTGKAIDLKNRAWLRITEAFNKRSPHKRSTKVLRTKFCNLKRSAKNGYFKKYFKDNHHEKLLEEDTKEIKAEPRFQVKDDSDIEAENNKSDVGDNFADEDENINDVLPDSATNIFPDPVPDPLSTILNSDSGLGSSSFIGAYNFGNNEVTKLKMELLNYQLETAKLERQRIQEALKAESVAREAMAIEQSLKLRTARLEAIAAEMKLPSTHPGLQFNFQESKAQQYMNQYQHSNTH